MLSVAEWRWYHVLGFALISITTLVAVMILQLYLRRPFRLFLPYPSGFSGLARLLQAIWQFSPLVALQLVAGVALIAAVVGYWLVNRQ